MNEADLSNAIRRKCGVVCKLPLSGWHFSYHGRYFVCLPDVNGDMVRFCVPCIATVAGGDKAGIEAINATNRNVKYVKAVRLDSGTISLGYDHKTATDDSAEDIMAHIIGTLDFASTYLLDKLKENES